VSPRERDAFIDHALGLGPPPADGPDLPRGCVPYLPCPVDALTRALDIARVRASDVVVDIGCGAGRTAALAQLLTGAKVIGVEVQHRLAEASRALVTRLGLQRCAVFECDVLTSPACLDEGSVFFLYCPFGGQRLELLLTRLEQLAQLRELRICCVDLPLPARRWLERLEPAAPDLTVYRSASYR
jgi:SAM-dependent methyltransferase